MTRRWRLAFAAAVACVVLTGSTAADAQTTAAEPPKAQPTPKPVPPEPPQPTSPGTAKPVDKPAQPTYEETVVVSASRGVEKLINAPATMSVITAATIEMAPSQNLPELLRSIPGVNVTQVSARDINLTSRAATGTLATGQLALLDGRSLYQDFFGFVMWDFLPVNLDEVKQIEVIRGPASAVWGANALYGVVNVISKAPREMQGASGVLGFGGFGRGDQADAGGLWYLSGTWADAVNDRWSYKLSGGGFAQDAMARPTGTIPCGLAACASYPDYANRGTTQPKFDGRVDYDFEDGRTLSFSGGVAGTEGIMHSGIGPFDINSGALMGYAKASYTKGALRAGFFTNVLNGDADNLLSRSPLTGEFIRFGFDTTTVDFDLSNVQTFGKRHVVSYGGNLRFNRFDLSIAPRGDNRTELGVYGQDEIFISDLFRWVVGVRLDRFDYIDDVVVASPRTTVLIQPGEAHTFRVSYNRAYRAPSVINNFIDLVIAQPVDLRALGGPALYPLPVNIVGNQALEEQSLDAFEVGYSGIVLNGRAIISAAYYRNWLKNDILFTEDTGGRWTAATPPPNWPLNPALINFVPGRSLPGRFTYLNFGKSTAQGIELGVNGSVTRNVGVFVNYSYQADPDPDDFDISELNLPPNNRFNIGGNVSCGRFVGDLSVNYSDGAFWQDVLDDPFHGTTEAYTLVNAGAGWRWAQDRVTTSIKVVNLGNTAIQQHVFGDVMKRQMVGEVRVRY